MDSIGNQLHCFVGNILCMNSHLLYLPDLVGAVNNEFSVVKANEKYVITIPKQVRYIRYGLYFWPFAVRISANGGASESAFPTAFDKSV